MYQSDAADEIVYSNTQMKGFMIKADALFYNSSVKKFTAKKMASNLSLSPANDAQNRND
jgi:hypothetical protein